MLKRKIIIMTLACILAVGVPLSLFYVNNITNTEKYQVKNTDTIYINFIKDNLKDIFIEAKQLALYCSNDYRIINYFKKEKAEQEHKNIEAFTAYEILGRYLTSSNINRYVTKLIIFNDDGVFLQADTKMLGSLLDIENLKKSNIWEKEKKVFHFSKDITQNNDCVAILIPFDYSENTYVYLELSMDIFNKLKNIKAPTLDFTLWENGKQYLNNKFDESFYSAELNYQEVVNYYESIKGTFKYQGIDYLYDFHPIVNTNFILLSTINFKSLGESYQKAIFTTLYLSLTAIAIAILLAFGLSSIITKRAHLIINHINKIKKNNFTPNEEIEKGDDEFSLIGETLNDMGLEIETLLKQTKIHYEKEKKQELALLQKQINPHFLYNTLESIYWMAKIQKVPGIAKMTRSLSDLLKHLAKGTEQKIPLKEELKLLESYIQIQKIRYVEMFDYICEIPEKYLNYKIIKFTLQPLFENSIYHGIEPKKEFGTIKTYMGKEYKDKIEIILEDDGIGIQKDKIEKILSKDETEHSHKGLNSIGLKNVADRIKLTYGEEFGLRIESKVGIGTKIYILLPKEI